MRDSAFSINWHPVARVDKFDDDQVAFVQDKTGLFVPTGDMLAFYCKPFETVEVEGNLLTTAGATRILNKLIGAAGQILTGPGGTPANTSRLGVGNSSSAEAAGQTDLQGASKWYQLQDATYPQVATNVLTCKATYATGDANFIWAEWGIDIADTPPATSGATVNQLLLNRKVAALGTKASGSWVLTVTVTIS